MSVPNFDDQLKWFWIWNFWKEFWKIHENVCHLYSLSRKFWSMMKRIIWKFRDNNDVDYKSRWSFWKEIEWRHCNSCRLVLRIFEFNCLSKNQRCSRNGNWMLYDVWDNEMRLLRAEMWKSIVKWWAMC